MIQVQLACLVVALIEKEEGKISTSVVVGKIIISPCPNIFVHTFNFF